MENIYKVKIKTNPARSCTYPSERRYSASTVLGLGVVHLALALTALLLASLSLSSVKPTTKNTTSIDFTYAPTTEIADVSTTELPEISPIEPSFSAETAPSAAKRRKRRELEETADESYANLSIGPFIMTVGSLLAGIGGLLAWKRWYIDKNIKWFFYSSIISSATSFICFALTAFEISSVGELKHIQFSNNFEDFEGERPSLSLVLAINTLIASISEVVWSLLSSKLAYQGMRNEYPDEIGTSRSKGRIEVNTITKGNGKNKLVPPDILNHFPTEGKLAKYFPRKVDENLPKAESHSEYQERVNKFLHSQGDSNSAKTV